MNFFALAVISAVCIEPRHPCCKGTEPNWVITRSSPTLLHTDCKREGSYSNNLVSLSKRSIFVTGFVVLQSGRASPLIAVGRGVKDKRTEYIYLSAHSGMHPKSNRTTPMVWEEMRGMIPKLHLVRKTF